MTRNELRRNGEGGRRSRHPRQRYSQHSSVALVGKENMHKVTTTVMTLLWGTHKSLIALYIHFEESALK